LRSTRALATIRASFLAHVKEALMAGIPESVSRRPTRTELRRDFWRSDDRRVFVRREWCVGWTIDLARLSGRSRTE